MSEQSAYNFLYLFQRKKGDDHPTIPCNYLYQQVKGLKKHEKDIQDPDSATREFLDAQEQKEETYSLSSAYFTRLRQQEGAVSGWVKECELYSFHTYPKQTRADCQNSNTLLNMNS